MMLRVVRYRYLWFGFSFLLVAGGLVFLLLGGLHLGTDFTGGSLLQVQFDERMTPAVADIEKLLSDNGYLDTRVQSAGEKNVIIRTKQLNADRHTKLTDVLKGKYGKIEEVSYSEVGPTLGRELQQKAILAVVLVLVGIILYISWAFRKSAGQISGWAFGINAFIALIHDVGITLGAFAFLGYVFHIEIDALFVTALLTVLGFSVHDTIVVFDRIREGLRRHPNDQLVDIIDRSVNETLVRSINTSLSTLLVLVALYFFGGQTIRYFVLALIVGILIGTYSSIFLASPLLPYWRKK
ncbi:MAG: protein translocase subunit SecF [bacterium]